VAAKLRARAMPPVGRPRPDEPTYDAVASWLEGELDRRAATSPDPGRTEAFHRLNRVEYANAIRDLFALEVDVAELLPADDIDEHGFDNMADVLTVSPVLMERYLSAARKIARMVVGEAPVGPVTETYKVSHFDMQDVRMSDDLPFGSRGGVAANHYFPVAGEYDLEIRLHRNYVNYIRGMGSRHELEVRLDDHLVRSFFVGGEEPDVLQAPASYGGNQFGDPEWEEYILYADSHLRLRFEAEAGRHLVGISFVRRHTEQEGVLQPRQSAFATAANEERDGLAAVEYAAIRGPYTNLGVGDTAARRAVFSCTPAEGDIREPLDGEQEGACAQEILGRLARRAYRRSVDSRDLATLLEFFRSGRSGGNFDSGIQLALERILIAPDFLFRIERDPAAIAPSSVYPLSSLELASRLSFFLWSSVPDEELLDLAVSDRLRDPDVLEAQARRMLADARATELSRNFAGQWLNLRNLAGVVPDALTFPEFDENLRRAFRRETELVLDSMIRGDRGMLDLLRADYTFANERLARHYGIPNVYGSHFRRVELVGELAERRGSIFGHGSVLTATSYPNRTSPVLRGKWVLASILGAPPPPPPADIPDLPDRGQDGRAATVRDRLRVHRESPACAACHAPMDPLGLALENYDAIGNWRTTGEGGLPIDSSGTLPGGLAFEGPSGLRDVLLSRPEPFLRSTTEKLLSYALGRAAETADRPVVRSLLRDAEGDGYRWSSIIVGIVRSEPFRMRRSAS
ncbi:MAG: DUF1592 domain-containing protein, partial [Acidobacteriota bacterium]|nr:DUF1592 domain-containing protein [Acidobacteriota bacterium]